jgi:glycosyltransferase involved in cell wall biosynthesis
MSARVVALIPCYREAARIGEVVRRARPHVDAVVVIDDGSPDATAQEAKSAGAIVLQHPVNQGKGAAIRTGMNYAVEKGYELMVFLDGDGQHNPDEIPKFIEAQRASDAAIVVGNRMTDVRRMPLLRKWTNQFTSWMLSRMAGQRIDDSQCGYRLLHRRVVSDIRMETCNFETESEMLIQAGRAGHRITGVPVQTIYEGQEKQSKIRPGRDSVRFLTLLWRNRRRG